LINHFFLASVLSPSSLKALSQRDGPIFDIMIILSHFTFSSSTALSLPTHLYCFVAGCLNILFKSTLFPFTYLLLQRFLCFRIFIEIVFSFCLDIPLCTYFVFSLFSPIGSCAWYLFDVHV
jgi:hypothetical protein